MTTDKAREFFSAFQEGTLEPGLRASLERRLQADSGLRAEFEAFVSTVDSLDALRYEAIEIPAYLSDRIARRIDPVLDAKRVPFWQALFAPRAATPRYGWAMGVAGLLLVASVGLRGLRSSGTQTAGVVSTGGESVRWTVEGSNVVATFAPSSARGVGVQPEGGPAQEYRLTDGQPLELTLQNPNAAARRFHVNLGGGAMATVAVPGNRPTARHAGSGTVAELATALADAYRVPVVVKGAALETAVRWNFESADARAAAEQSLEGRGNATMTDGNVLQIGQ